MSNTKLVKAYCSKTNKHFGLEVLQFGGKWKVVNFIELTDDEAKITVSEVKQDSFETNTNLLPCKRCGSRKVGGCRCTERETSCSHDMKYKFNCIYCDKMTIDYSLPKRSDLRGVRAGDKVTLSQGKEVQIVTFDNVEWIKFDNIKNHVRSSFKEPPIHVVYGEENIEFHGYCESPMDEGVYYDIDARDDFEIECDVDTSTISPHPGGFFYIKFGSVLEAKIDQNGGNFSLQGRTVARVGSKFRMKLSLTDGCHYEVSIDGELKGSADEQSRRDIRIVFGFNHGPHCCSLLSHAYVRDIKMKQGYFQ